jgi:hypothetical protein
MSTDRDIEEEETEDRLPAPPTRRVVRRAGHLVEVTVGPVRETR